MRRVLACLLLVVSAAGAQQGDVRARLGAATVPLDESVTLSVEAYDVEGELDTSALERDFEVTVRSRSTRFEIVDGSRSVLLTYVLELVPRAVGVYTVPPVRVGVAESDPLTLEVTAPPTGAARDFFVEADVDRASPLVQAQTILTLRLWFGRSVIDVELEPPRGDGLVVESLGDATQRRGSRDGREYQVLEQRYAVFAQTSGPLVLEPGALGVSVSGDTSGSRGAPGMVRRLVRRAPPIPLEVRARPAGGAGWWLPATDVALDAAWPGGTQARVGEPLTRSISLRAAGVRADQLPEIAFPPVAGASVHADTPESAAATNPDGLVAETRVVQAIIPEASGPLTLPALEVTWFDTRAERERVARLEPVTLDVRPSARAPAGAGAPPVEPSTSALVETAPATPAQDVPATIGGQGESGAEAGGGTGGWRVAALVALFGWLLTALAGALWWRRRGVAGPAANDGALTDARVARSTDGAQRVRRLVAAAREGAPPAVRDAALALAAARWPDDPPPTLPALAARLDDEGLRDELLALDAGLYGRSHGIGSGRASDESGGGAPREPLVVRIAARLEGMAPTGARRARAAWRGPPDTGLPPL